MADKKQPPKGSKIVGVSKSYEYVTEVNLSSKFVCGRTGISTTYGELTNDQIEAIIAAGSSSFVKIEKKPNS